MSSDNINSLALEYEGIYNKCNDLVQLMSQGKEGKGKLTEVNSQLENLDYLLNQMDLEYSLMPKEDQQDIVMHKICRNHYNDLRKKIMELEKVGGKASKASKAVDRDSETGENSLLDDNSYDQGVQDLRSKYGVTLSDRDSSVPQELLEYRKKKIMEKRLMIGGVVIGAILLIYIVVKVL